MRTIIAFAFVLAPALVLASAPPDHCAGHPTWDAAAQAWESGSRDRLEIAVAHYIFSGCRVATTARTGRFTVDCKDVPCEFDDAPIELGISQADSPAEQSPPPPPPPPPPPLPPPAPAPQIETPIEGGSIIIPAIPRIVVSPDYGQIPRAREDALQPPPVIPTGDSRGCSCSPARVTEGDILTCTHLGEGTPLWSATGRSGIEGRNDQPLASIRARGRGDLTVSWYPGRSCGTYTVTRPWHKNPVVYPLIMGAIGAAGGLLIDDESSTNWSAVGATTGLTLGALITVVVEW